MIIEKSPAQKKDLSNKSLVIEKSPALDFEDPDVTFEMAGLDTSIDCYGMDKTFDHTTVEK